MKLTISTVVSVALLSINSACAADIQNYASWPHQNIPQYNDGHQQASMPQYGGYQQASMPNYNNYQQASMPQYGGYYQASMPGY